MNNTQCIKETRKNIVGETMLNIGVVLFFIGMIAATFVVVAGYSVEPIYFRWFMGISFLTGFIGAGLRDKKEEGEQIQ